MAAVNKAIILGNLGQDPEMHYSSSGKAIVNLSVATSEKFKDRDGNSNERTEWHRIVLFGRQAEVAGEYLRKGSTAYFEGRLQTRKWEDRDGVERYTTEIVCDRMQLIGSAKGGNGDRESHRESRNDARQQNSPRGNAGPANNHPPIDNDDFDDIPFAQGDFTETTDGFGKLLKRVRF
ncbi:single-stranded DNA-binding protein [Acidithiobacillus marinus]|uniref:Single-stranded DNA-binding protein n=1 Tax=Acidithiobacillus marinus TaxID=187490 RepID=A0A2I1DIX9_9PROT|nr:single-stranded DNA-binding protein [Acidithiobacillus marinus]PKY09834.1 single-stranded DNA-binding protein [Acidithiobacillus marinus]